MKRMGTMMLFCLSLLITAGFAGTQPRVALKPEGAIGEIAIVNAGKIRSYYPLSAKKPAIVLLKGPGELRVLTRARFTPRSKDNLNYRITYKVDGGEAHTLDVEGVKRSSEASFRDEALGVPGDSHDLTLRLGRGYHTIELVQQDSLPKIAARFLFAPGKQVKMKWIALEPIAPIEPVELLTKEESSHYYRFSPEKPLKIEVIGPTELRVLTRVENSYNMIGEANYRVQIRQFGQVVRTFQLSSKRSETTSYRDSTKLVPGKAREVVFKVPEGKQQYEIVPLDNASILGSLLFPEKDIDLEE